MQITFHDSFIEELFQAGGKAKPDLIKAVADQIISTIDPLAIARYLLDRSTAVSLLAARLESNPRKVLRDLDNGANSTDGSAPPTRSGKSAGRSAATGSRARVTKEAVQRLKDATVAYLKCHEGGRGRKDISAATGLDSASPHLYNRVMGELQKEKRIKSKGSRRNTIYSAR